MFYYEAGEEGGLVQIAGGIGVVLALVFAFMLFAPLNTLQGVGAGASGLQTSVVNFFQVLPSIWMIILGVLLVLAGISAFTILVKGG